MQPCGSTAQWPASQVVASHCTGAQRASDTVWPSLGASKPLPTISSKCGHDKVPMTNRNPAQSFLTLRSFTSQNQSQCLFSKMLPAEAQREAEAASGKGIPGRESRCGLKGSQGEKADEGSRDKQLWWFCPQPPMSKGHLDSLPGTKCSLPSDSDQK